MNAAFSIELFDKDKLFYVLDNPKKFIVPLDSLDMIRKYFMYSTGYSKTGYINVDYEGDKTLYAKHGLSLQMMNKKIRHAIASEYYVDIDIVNSHPVMLEYICRLHKIPCEQLTYYNNNREIVLNAYPVDRGQVKDLLIKLINNGTGNIYKRLKKKEIKLNDATCWIQCFHDELIEIRYLLKNLYKKQYEQLQEHHVVSSIPQLVEISDEVQNNNDDEAEYNMIELDLTGKLISALMRDIESKVLQSMIEFFKEEGIINSMSRMDCVLCFDGLLLNRNKWPSPSEEKKILHRCQEYVAKHTGVMMQLKIKSMDGIPIVSSRPSHHEDIYLYDKYLTQIKTWKDVGKLKNEIVHFINKDTVYLRGEQPMIIKEEYIQGERVSVFKLDSGYKLDMCNVKFIVKPSEDEINKYQLKASNFIIEAYKIWITSRYRNDKRRIIFDPEWYYSNKSTDDIYNLFDGLAIERDDLYNVKPLEEDAPFFKHIMNIWCDGDVKLYEYILNWFTSIISHPWKKLRTCIVAKSTERAGKGIIIDLIRAILGEKYVFHPSSPKDILGDFNNGLRNKLLVFVDELTWGGDRERAGVFKKLISEKTISINEKFKSIYTVQNLVNIIVASNEEWVIPAGRTDTRWLVIALNPYLTTCNIKTKSSIINDIRATDLKRLAKFFYTRDISKWNSDNIIMTESLREQRIHSMSPFNKWWLDSINSGCISTDQGNKYFFGTHSIPREVLYDSFKKYSNDKHTTNRTFQNKIKTIADNPKITRPRIGGLQKRCIELPQLKVVHDIWRNIFGDKDWIFDEPEIPNTASFKNAYLYDQVEKIKCEIDIDAINDIV